MSDKVLRFREGKPEVTGRGASFSDSKYTPALFSVFTALSSHSPEQRAIVSNNPSAWLLNDQATPVVFIDVSTAFRAPTSEGRTTAFFDEASGEYGSLVHRVGNLQDAAAFLETPSVVESVLIDHTLPVSPKSGRIPIAIQGKARSEFTYDESPQASLVAQFARLRSLDEVIAVVPQYLLFGEQFRPFRQDLLTHIGVAAVVQLPPQVFQPVATFSSAILVLRRGHKRDRTLFYDLQLGELVEIEGQPWLRDFKSALEGNLAVAGFAADIRKSDTWTSEENEPRTRRIPNGLLEISNLVRIGDLFEVITGMRFPRETAQKGKGVAVLRGRDVGKAKSVEDLERFLIKEDIPPRVRVKRDDLLLQKIGSSPTISIAENLEGAVAGDTVLILRPRTTPQMSGVYQVLASRVGARLLSSVTHGAGARAVSIDRLSRLEVPLPPQEILEALSSAERAEDQIRQMADRADSLRSSVFLAQSRDEIEQNIAELVTTTDILRRGIAASDEITYRIRNFYPFPLAFPYRMIDTYLDTPSKYQQQIRVGEGIIAFVGSVTLALLAPSLSSLTNDITSSFRGGASAGKWQTLAQRAADLLEDAQSPRIALFIRGLWKTRKGPGNFSQAVHDFISIRNDFHHGRGPQTPPEIRAASERIAKVLESCLKPLGFFVQFPIRLTFDIDIERQSGLARITTLKYIGDHQALPQELIRHPRAIPKDELFIELDKSEWKLLFPFLTVRYCPTCHNRETFFIDRWQDGKATLKSFERGHIEESPDVSTALGSM